MVAGADDDFYHHHAALLSSADDAAALLRRHGADHWARWVEADVDRIRHGNPVGVDHLLTAFGGMGSLNDVNIHPANGHDVAEADVDQVNRRLASLLQQVSHHARAVKRELDRR